MLTNRASRRPLKTRSRAWAQHGARVLANTQVTPNQISLASLAFALAGSALLMRADPLGLLGCALCVQCRLLCNLLDGMVAIEGGKRSPLGEIYNEFPDRISDSLLLVALGYAIALPTLSWYAALAALLTAFIRVFGGSLGLEQDFRGPMAKQHRMAALTLGCLVGAVELPFFGTIYALVGVALIIAIGSTITCITRTIALGRSVQKI